MGRRGVDRKRVKQTNAHTQGERGENKDWVGCRHIDSGKPRNEENTDVLCYGMMSSIYKSCKAKQTHTLLNMTFKYVHVIYSLLNP